jgi:glyoxylase-like metal-dependent hydrolase (beta-lactamase superfamily II)
LRPSPDQIEVALFGHGYGECVLVHLGADHWIVVESCIDSHSGEPAALSYLRGLGVEPAQAVKLIVATHWHDDHVRGLSRVLDACHEASLCCASALGHKEFLAAVLLYEQRNLVAGGSGVREIAEVWRILERRDG